MPYQCCYKSTTDNDEGCNCQLFECSPIAGYTLTSQKYVESCSNERLSSDKLKTAYEERIAETLRYHAESLGSATIEISSPNIQISAEVKHSIPDRIPFPQGITRDYRFGAGTDYAGRTTINHHQFAKRLLDYNLTAETGLIYTDLDILQDGRTVRLTGTVGGMAQTLTRWEYTIEGIYAD
jgi:hypothetical protein